MVFGTGDTTIFEMAPGNSHVDIEASANDCGLVQSVDEIAAHLAVNDAAVCIAPFVQTNTPASNTTMQSGRKTLATKANSRVMAPRFSPLVRKFFLIADAK